MSAMIGAIAAEGGPRARVTASGEVLKVKNLRVDFRSGSGTVQAVRGVDLDVGRGRILGLVGESGSGKSAACMAILGLLPRSAARSGSIAICGTDVTRLDPEAFARFRGTRAAIVFQEPRRHLDPAMRIGAQIEEVLTLNAGLARAEARRRGLSLLAAVELDAERVAASYPHELSGGMCQRASIAIAISCDPALLIADEPTTALDASVQRSILDLIGATVRGRSMGAVFVTHDLRAVKYVADEVAVMLGGLVVERGPREELLSSPLHPYTRLLMSSVPGRPGQGRRPAVFQTADESRRADAGCPFAGRCPEERPECSRLLPELGRVGGPRGGRLLRCPPAGGAA